MQLDSDACWPWVKSNVSIGTWQSHPRASARFWRRIAGLLNFAQAASATSRVHVRGRTYKQEDGCARLVTANPQACA